MTDKITHYTQRLAEAQADVKEAASTTFMSDAKSAVYRLREEVKGDQSLDPLIKHQLISYLDEAWTAIIGVRGEEIYIRAWGSHAKLSEAEAYLKNCQ